MSLLQLTPKLFGIKSELYNGTSNYERKLLKTSSGERKSITEKRIAKTYFQITLPLPENLRACTPYECFRAYLSER